MALNSLVSAFEYFLSVIYKTLFLLDEANVVDTVDSCDDLIIK